MWRYQDSLPPQTKSFIISGEDIRILIDEFGIPIRSLKKTDFGEILLSAGDITIIDSFPNDTSRIVRGRHQNFGTFQKMDHQGGA